MRGLHRVPGIALLDRHRVEHARTADLVTPHLLHAGNAGIEHVLFYDRRAHHRAVARHLVGTGAHGRNANEDRIVTVIDSLDVDHGHVAHTAGIVSGPFPERSFRLAPVWR